MKKSFQKSFLDTNTHTIKPQGSFKPKRSMKTLKSSRTTGALGFNKVKSKIDKIRSNKSDIGNSTQLNINNYMDPSETAAPASTTSSPTGSPATSPTAGPAGPRKAKRSGKGKLKRLNTKAAKTVGNLINKVREGKQGYSNSNSNGNKEGGTESIGTEKLSAGESPAGSPPESPTSPIRVSFWKESSEGNMVESNGNGSLNPEVDIDSRNLERIY
jgi:hypothetical protein